MSPSAELVDWSLAARVGRSVAGGGPPSTPAARSSVRRDFQEFTRISDELVRRFTGLAPADPAPDPLVLDRGGWVRANLDGFRGLIHPLTEKLSGAVPLSGFARRATAAALGVQIGVLLGYLSQKVLGQYDLVLATQGSGRVYFVGPNVLEAERRWNLTPRDFRLWITLHEITHRTQFTGVPWLRERVRALMERSFGAMELDPARIRQVIARGRELLLKGPAAWRNVNVMTLLMSDEQRAVLGEMQVLMCVVEGHGTFVMNRIGERQIPSYAEMKRAVEARRGARGPERVFQRAIGMDMKYDQYRIGERFMNEVAARAGLDAVNRVWADDGANMPTLDEMRDAGAWLERVEP